MRDMGERDSFAKIPNQVFYWSNLSYFSRISLVPRVHATSRDATSEDSTCPISLSQLPTCPTYLTRPPLVTPHLSQDAPLVPTRSSPTEARSVRSPHRLKRHASCTHSFHICDAPVYPFFPYLAHPFSL